MSSLDDIRKRTEGHTPGPWELTSTKIGPIECHELGMGWESYSAYVYADIDLARFAPDLLRIATEQEAELAEAVKLLRSMVDTIGAHDIDSLSCDRDGREYCECLTQTVGDVQAFLARQEAK